MLATIWQIGDRIQNRWDIHKILRGGMGIVYVVYDPASRAVYAAKTFQEEVFARSADIADRFNQEALTWVNLDVHQNVARAHFVSKIAGKPYLFLEYVSGGDLSRWIGTPRLTEDLPQALRFAVQFCDGMVHALAKGITAHRDIKPHNCLIAKNEILKVTDFGLARAEVAAESRGSAAGTPEYMPPEQWDRFEKATERSDIYSFGAMLYEMLVGMPPFGKRPQVRPAELERRHKFEPAPVLVSHPAPLRELVTKCLAKDAALRFENFGQVRERLAVIYLEIIGSPAPRPVVGRDLTVDDLVIKGASLGTLGRHEEELCCYDAAIDLDPKASDAWSNKGTALRDLGRPDEALVCLQRALTMHPSMPMAWSNKGLVLLDLGQREEALNCIDRALELNPYYARGWYNKGTLLADLGRFPEALGCYERANSLDPHYETAWVNRGVMLRRLSRFEESVICYQKALGLDVRDIHAWSGKGNTLSRMGRNEEALTCYDEALDLDPCDAKVWCNRGAVLNRLGLTAEALTSFDRALELDPRDEKSWHNRGVVMFVGGSAAMALHCFERCVALKPDYVEPWLNMGVLYFRQKDFVRAERCFDRALAINDLIGEAWFNKGASLLEAHGPSDQVLRCFEKAHGLGIEEAEVAATECRKMIAKQRS